MCIKLMKLILAILIFAAMSYAIVAAPGLVIDGASSMPQQARR